MNQIMSYNKYFGLLAVLLSCIIKKHCIIQNIVLYKTLYYTIVKNVLIL